jgi:hypothetical protein
VSFGIVKGGSSVPSSIAPLRMPITSSDVSPFVSTMAYIKKNNYLKFISLK